MGDREHLFGRQVRRELDAGSADRVAAHPDVRRWQADRQLGAGPRISQRVVALPIEIVRARRELVDVLLPGGDRIRPIEAAQAVDLVPQPCDLFVGPAIRKHLGRPAGARRRDDRPVRLVPRDQLAERLHRA